MSINLPRFLLAGLVVSLFGRPIPAIDEGAQRRNLFIPTGFSFEAILETAVFSYNLATPVISLVDEDIKFLEKIVIPHGTKLIGEVQVLHTLDRVNICFHTCVFPDGSEIKVDFLALSLDGSAGIKGKVQKHKDAVAAKVAMKSILAGVQGGAQATVPTVESAMAVGLTQDALQTLETQNVKSIESISVEEHTPIRIFNNKRLEY